MPTILCYGDSNTHGSVPLPAGRPRERYGRDVRWPGVMRRALGVGYEVIEEALPGRTTVHDDPVARANRNGLATLIAALESHRPVDVVVLMLGTNDLKARVGATPSDIARGIERLGRIVLDASWDHGAGPGGDAPGLLVVAPPPLPEDGPFAVDEPGAAATSHAAVPLIRAVAEGLGAAFIDAGTVARFSPVDGVHLDEAGHAALGEAIAEAVSGLASIKAT